MKIVVLDGYTENPGDLSWGELEKLGELTVYDRTSLTDEEEITSRIGDAEVVFTNKTPISRHVLESCPSVKFISVLATGYNVVDYNYAREKGIPVTNVPTYGTDAVGQFAIALLLEICHHVAHHSEAVHQGRWESNPDWCFWDYPLIELAGKTMGIIGFGRIGQKTGTIAKALGMRILAFSPHESETGRKIGEYVDLDTLLAESDEAGVFLVMSRDGRQVFIQGHPEYDRMTLANEYQRDLQKGLNPKLPCNYYENNDPFSEPILSWRNTSGTIYCNWLNYYVYQTTPYDLRNISST